MSASFVLPFMLASLYGLFFFLFFGQGWLRFVLYWLAGVLGFFLGQWLASHMGLAILNIGEVNLVEGTLASWLSLFGVRAWRDR